MRRKTCEQAKVSLDGKTCEPKIASEKLLLAYKDNYSYLQEDRIVLNSKTAVSVTKVQPLGQAGNQ